MEYTQKNPFFQAPRYTNPNFFEQFQSVDSYKAREVLTNLLNEGISLERLNSIEFDQFILLKNPGVMGYFNTETKAIRLSPLILTLSANAITHIILHESLHAGWHPLYEGVEMYDEAITEFVTREIIKEIYYGQVDFTSGYLEIVSALENLFANRDITPEIIAGIIQAEESNTLDILLIEVVLTPLVLRVQAYGILEMLDGDRILSELDSKWGLINRLFPRLLNKIYGNGNGLHESANYDLPLSRKARFMHYAAKVIGYNPRIQGYIFENIVKHHMNKPAVHGGDPNLIDMHSFYNTLKYLGYSYLVEYLDYSLANPNNLFNLFNVYVNNYRTRQNARLSNPVEG